MATTVTVEVGQSLLDIAVQHAGSVEKLFEIASANNVSVTDDVHAGVELNIPEIENKAVTNIYAVSKIKPATGISNTDITNTIASEGVEFWAIEMDFIVS